MSFIYHKNNQNIVTLTMDMQGKSVNVINKEFLKSLLNNVKKLEKEKDFFGVIITSAKKTFLDGTDIETLYKQKDPHECFNLVEAKKAIMRRLELIGKPIVAAINGTALGGGMELALCCHHRVVFNDPKATFGFPEVSLGLLPGGGGTTRLPRIIGIEAALSFLIEGRQVKPSKAVEMGLMDELANSKSEMLKKATAWILENAEFQQPWDRKGFKIPKGDAHHPKIANMLAIAPAVLYKKTRGNFPAPEAILSATVEGSLVNYETASKIESRYFVELVTGKVSKNIINATWFQMNEINSGASRPIGIAPTFTTRVGVLGSGLMGHGIAYITALSGMEVIMLDTSKKNVNKGIDKIKKILEGSYKRGLISKNKIKETLQRITPTVNYADLESCDLIIEAVFEDRALKAKVSELAEGYMDAKGIFASNTSSIPITSLAKKSKRPDKFIGIHFFSPVHKMKLVEIIKGQETSAETLAKAFDYAIKIRKIPIIVNDSRGFYTSRVFERYTCEGMALLAEGNSPQSIESAGRKAGFPVGPLAVIDEINIGLVARIRDQARTDLKAEGKELPTGSWDQVIDFMTKDANRLGRAVGRGFYEYPETGKKYLWPKLQKRFPSAKKQLLQEEMIDRFYYAQAVETARCFEEGVLTSVADANIGSIFGWGFPLFKGGTLQFINNCGLEVFRDRAKDLAAKYGKRFSPPALIDDMIKNRKIF